MKTLALDIGDRWTGVAISDFLGIIARPYDTIETNDLISFLKTTIDNEEIKVIIVGYPKTMRGTESEQTKKVSRLFHELQSQFNNIEWNLWDERLTSKQATSIQHKNTSQNKKKVHAVAAALILNMYLDSKRIDETSS